MNTTKPSGRPMQGTAPKVPFSASVTAATSFQIGVWKDTLPAGKPAHPGLVLDRLVEHGKATAFDPAKEKPEPATTPAPVQSHAHASRRSEKMKRR